MRQMVSPAAFPAATVNQGKGYLHTEWTVKSNTVCDVLDGYYCIHNISPECSFAVKHTHCAKGQRAKAQGTKSTDKICEDCQHGFYSENGVNCTAWTDCASKRRVTTEEGGSDTDAVLQKQQESILL
ncbi:tumor necrosis factor receptor superfamily member 14-like [Hypomesus transpacificus]|uniref:tumor necrosis factor receptor superfamily member 14-like n=1 Tax=Hypomesus transpacificus TaxID=137520 RepID=UPI001F0779C3|nr:tumor necrosis factor receptor superfamily member 14-like [Hypomesus transpacificus]